MEAAEGWSVKRHLADRPKDVIDLYNRFVMLVSACGPYTTSVTKTAIAFNGTHRGFAGAKPRTPPSTDSSIYNEKCGIRGSCGYRNIRRNSMCISFESRVRCNSMNPLPGGSPRHIKLELGLIAVLRAPPDGSHSSPGRGRRHAQISWRRYPRACPAGSSTTESDRRRAIGRSHSTRQPRWCR